MQPTTAELVGIARIIEDLDDDTIARLARILVERGSWATGSLIDHLGAEYSQLARDLGI